MMLIPLLPSIEISCDLNLISRFALVQLEVIPQDHHTAEISILTEEGGSQSVHMVLLNINVIVFSAGTSL